MAEGCAWQGGMCGGRGMHGGAVCMAGGCMAGSVYGRRDGHCSRRYASNCNAFLLDIVSVGLKVNELDTLQLIG